MSRLSLFNTTSGEISCRLHGIGAPPDLQQSAWKQRQAQRQSIVPIRIAPHQDLDVTQFQLSPAAIRLQSELMGYFRSGQLRLLIDGQLEQEFVEPVVMTPLDVRYRELLSEARNDDERARFFEQIQAYETAKRTTFPDIIDQIERELCGKVSTLTGAETSFPSAVWVASFEDEFVERTKAERHLLALPNGPQQAMRLVFALIGEIRRIVDPPPVSEPPSVQVESAEFVPPSIPPNPNPNPNSAPQEVAQEVAQQESVEEKPTKPIQAPKKAEFKCICPRAPFGSPQALQVHQRFCEIWKNHLAIEAENAKGSA